MEHSHKNVYLVGQNIGNSLSPKFFNAGFEWFRKIHNGDPYFNYQYHLAETDGSYESFAKVMDKIWIKGSNTCGCSITSPHKSQFKKWCLDRVSNDVNQIHESLDTDNCLSMDAFETFGCINTIAHSFLANTDAASLESSLSKKISEGHICKDALVYGAGDVAKATVKVLQKIGAKVTILNRSSKPDIHGVQVTKEFSHGVSFKNAFDTVIDCTDGYFMEDKKIAHPPALFVDWSYKVSTDHIMACKEIFPKYISGMELFVGQASRQFFLFTGERAPAESYQAVLF